MSSLGAAIMNLIRILINMGSPSLEEAQVPMQKKCVCVCVLGGVICRDRRDEETERIDEGLLVPGG
jgi:hypothetical protein